MYEIFRFEFQPRHVCHQAKLKLYFFPIRIYADIAKFLQRKYLRKKYSRAVAMSLIQYILLIIHYILLIYRPKALLEMAST